MPFWKPGSLSGEEAWQVTAFLLRENLLWDSREELTEANAALVLIAPSPAALSPQPKAASGAALFLLIAVTISFVVLYFILRYFTSKGESKP